MNLKFAVGLFLALFVAVPMGSAQFALAQDARDAQEATQEAVFKTEELDQMLAPIALYPDELLANILMASTYPLDVVQAARWRKEPTNAKLKDEALTKALEEKNWDPSIKALVMFPEILQNMSDKLEWTQKLGDAFLAQEEDVFARVQYLRQKADEAGNLKTTKQQKVTKEADTETRTEYIVIEPAEADILYVPVYQPTVVYGSWWYPSYPPYYWNWYPGATFVSGFFWGAGFAIANDLWGWNRCDWRRGNIDIDVNRYNNINVNRANITNNKWEHNAKQRGSVPYRDKGTREKFAKDTKTREKNKDFSGYDKSKVGDRTDADRVKDKLGERGLSKDNVRDRDLSAAKDKVSDRDLSTAKDKVGGGKGKPVAKDVQRKDVKKPSKSSSKAMDIKPKAQVTKQSNRGDVSRKSAASHPKAQSSGGGMSRSGGGGGGGRAHGGGGRR